MAACCPFCNLPRERIVAASERMRAIRDAFPASLGHTLLLPRRHVVSLFDLTVVEWVELGQLLARIRKALHAEFQPDGFNIGINEGAAAGQTVMHLHVHLIPRYRGDQPDPRGGVYLPGQDALRATVNKEWRQDLEERGEGAKRRDESLERV